MQDLKKNQVGADLEASSPEKKYSLYRLVQCKSPREKTVAPVDHMVLAEELSVPGFLNLAAIVGKDYFQFSLVLQNLVFCPCIQNFMFL